MSNSFYVQQLLCPTASLSNNNAVILSERSESKDLRLLLAFRPVLRINSVPHPWRSFIAPRVGKLKAGS
jgi:hypothetical protein